MPNGISRALLRKRIELVHRLAVLTHQVDDIRKLLASVDTAIKLVEAAFKPPKTKPRKPPRPRGWLRHGKAAGLSLAVLREAGKPLTTPEIAQRIANMRELSFPTKPDAEDFALSIAMALGCYKRKSLCARWATEAGMAKNAGS